MVLKNISFNTGQRNEFLKVNYPAAELRGIKNMKSPQDLNVTLNSVQGLVLKDSETSSE